MRTAGSRRFAQAALLVFGAPLLLLLLSAAGAAAFATDQPLWSLAGMALVPGLAAHGWASALRRAR